MDDAREGAAPSLQSRVLMVAPTRRDLEVTCAILLESGTVCEGCADLRVLATEVERGAGAIILTDAVLVDRRLDGLQRVLSRQPPWSDLPIILLTRDREWSEQAKQAISTLTNVTLVDMPTSRRSLSSAVASALRARHRQYQIRDQLLLQAETEEALRVADRRKDEFLATLAHELRNPLAAIRTGVHLAARGGADAERTQRVVGMIDRQSRLLVKLIDDLLDVSRIATGKVVLAWEFHDLRSIVEAAVETGQVGLETAHHDVRIELPPDPVWVRGDAPRLTQVVGNLINNAAKYTPDGGRIRISLSVADATAVIDVSDNGLGIPPDMLPGVFDLFAQVNRTLDRAQGGLGIGLSLVRRLVEMHGGSVTAASAGPNFGSTFTVRLPLAAPAAPEVTDTAPDGHAAEAVGVPSWKVLVIDDNADVAESLADLLQAEGHDTRISYGGAAGIQAAKEFVPDVVFCDIGMPGVNGHDVAIRLRGDATLPCPLLVAVTGWGNEEERRRTAQAGFDLHLTKPIDPRAVVDLLRTHAARR
ncbi:MAG TPA: hybrid sensor histidine kinase/response regulator [Caldimonas sp.]|nr:hybrid sensor histidine kinase/response regulator [Caldimonas sp.]